MSGFSWPGGQYSRDECWPKKSFSWRDELVVSKWTGEGDQSRGKARQTNTNRGTGNQVPFRSPYQHHSHPHRPWWHPSPVHFYICTIHSYIQYALYKLLYKLAAPRKTFLFGHLFLNITNVFCAPKNGGGMLIYAQGWSLASQFWSYTPSPKNSFVAPKKWHFVRLDAHPFSGYAKMCILLQKA